MSVCPSARNNSVPTGKVFMKFDIFIFFEKSVEKIQGSLKCNKNNKYSTQRRMYIYDVLSHSYLFITRYVQTVHVEKINTQFLFNKFFPEHRAVYEIMWKNVQPDRPQMTIWRMRFACWVPKATKTLRLRNVYSFFHCTNGSKNATQYHAIHTYIVCLIVIYSEF